MFNMSLLFFFPLFSASLIELLAEVLDAQQNLFGKRIQPVEKWLKRYLKSGFVLRYERRKEIASDETIGTAATVQPFVLTPTLVSRPGRVSLEQCKLDP